MGAVGQTAWSHSPERGPGRRTRKPIKQPSAHERSPLLVKVIDGCLLTLLFAAPLLMGGRHPVGGLVWMVLAVVLGVCTLWHYRPRNPSTGDLLWLAALALVILQLIPLPPSILLWLNPGLENLLPALGEPGSFPLGKVIFSDRPLSVNPYSTRLALGMLLAYGVIFHTVTRRLQTHADVRRMLKWIALATIWIAVVALVQKFAGNGKFLWVYQHISRDASDVVKGPFQNQNHFAHLMALGIGPLVYFATERTQYRIILAASSGVTLCLLAGLLTFSRGGAIAIATAFVLALAGAAYAGRLRPQYLLRILLPAVTTLILLGIWGGEKLQARLETLTGSSSLSVAASTRLELWQAHLRAIAASPWMGYGAATHEDVYPSFISTDLGVTFTHGESGYLPIQLENGALGSALLAFAVLWVLGCVWRTLRPAEYLLRRRQSLETSAQTKLALTAGCLSGLAASLVQSAADFVWYIPACLTTTLILVACLYRLTFPAADESGTEHSPEPRFFPIPWLAVPVALLMVAMTWGVGPARASHSWDRYHAMFDGSGSSETDAVRTVSPRQAIPVLESIVALTPNEPVARLRLATALLAYSVDSSLPDSAAHKLRRDALANALLGLRSAPLRGEGYVVIADAARRSETVQVDPAELLKQAVRVRSSDMEVRLRAGLVAFQTGNTVWGMEVWKPMVEMASPKRHQILTMLANHLPSELMLGAFDLDHEGLAVLYAKERQTRSRNEALLETLGGMFVEALARSAQATKDTTLAASLYARACLVQQQISGSPEQALRFAERAVQAAPTDYEHRISLIQLLIQGGRWEDAQRQLRWCRSRKPTDPHIARQEALLIQAMQRRYQR